MLEPLQSTLQYTPRKNWTFTKNLEDSCAILYTMEVNLITIFICLRGDSNSQHLVSKTNDSNQLAYQGFCPTGDLNPEKHSFWDC